MSSKEVTWEQWSSNCMWRKWNFFLGAECKHIWPESRKVLFCGYRCEEEGCPTWDELDKEETEN